MNSDPVRAPRLHFATLTRCNCAGATLRPDLDPPRQWLPPRRRLISLLSFRITRRSQRLAETSPCSHTYWPMSISKTTRRTPGRSHSESHRRSRIQDNHGFTWPSYFLLGIRTTSLPATRLRWQSLARSRTMLSRSLWLALVMSLFAIPLISSVYQN